MRGIRHNTRRTGLTLIEVITTIAILGTFMTLLSFHLVGLSNIWLQGTDDDFYEQHVDGVTLFLTNALAASEAVQAGSGGEGQRPVEWAPPPGWREFDPPLLHFRQAEAPALFVREGDSLPAIRAYLSFESNRGLSILWFSGLDATPAESPNDLLHTPISRLVSKLEYAYFDRENLRWEIVDRPKEEERGVYILPHFLRLTFNHPDKGERQRAVFIPQKSLDVPIF